MIHSAKELLQSRVMRLRKEKGVPFYSFPSFDALSFVQHGFSTRLGGVSKGVYDSMNLSFTRADDEAAVRENFVRFCGALGSDVTRTVISAQTHTVNVRVVGKEDCGRGITRERGYTDVDGLITNTPGVLLCTQYADCVPLFFVDPVRRVVATSHAGWKGTAGGIGGITVREMQRVFGCDPKDILAAIGPSIGACCFEVDSPVYEVFAALPSADEKNIREDGGGKYHIDLWEFNRRDLLAAGVTEEHITVTDLCTRCHPDVFWSHRATGGVRGSLAGFIGIKEE